MIEKTRRQIAGHDVIEGRTDKPYRPYDRLVLRERHGRTIWKILLCEPAKGGWEVTAIRCPDEGCRMRWRRTPVLKS